MKLLEIYKTIRRLIEQVSTFIGWTVLTFRARMTIDNPGLNSLSAEYINMTHSASSAMWFHLI